MEDFADCIIGRIVDNGGLFVTVIGKFDTIKPLLKEVISYKFVDFESIEIESGAMDNYVDEFILSLWSNDGFVEIGCEKLKRNGDYINPCGDETYLLEDCSSKIIPLCEDSDLYFVNFDEESDYDENCDGCCSCDCCCSDRENVNAEESFYSINGKAVTKAEFDEKYEEFYEKYERHTRSFLNKYRELMDDLNNLPIRLW